MELKISIKEAVEVLKLHRENHIKDYKEALDVWRSDMDAYGEALTKWVAGDNGNDRPYEPNRPRNYLGEYDKLIAKLGHHRDATIVLDDHEYSKVFEDDFHWQRQFQRQKAPIYTMGDANPGSFSRGATITNASIGSLSANKITAGVLSDSDSSHVPLEDE